MIVYLLQKKHNKNQAYLRKLLLLGYFLILIWVSLELLLPASTLAEPNSSSSRSNPLIIIQEYQIIIKGIVQSGKRSLPVQNHGTMPHEVVIFKLKEGVTAARFIEEVGKGGSLRPLGKMKGNMPAIEPGVSSQVTSTFEVGDYLLLCFQVDPETLKPHFMIGMLQEFRVNLSQESDS